MDKLGARPFYFKGGAEGVLLVHGYTGAPGELRLLGEFLHGRGYTVLGVLLPGHGTTPQDLAQKDFACLYAEVERAYKWLSKICGRVYVIGLSMGGLLTLKAAAELKPDKIVVMAAPIFVHDKRQFLLPYLSFLIRYIKKRQRSFDVPEEYCVHYDRMPTRPLISMFRFVRECKNGYLQKVTAPCLIMQSKIERTVRWESALFIYDNIASAQKELAWYEHSGHILTLDKEREAVFKRILAFLQK